MLVQSRKKLNDFMNEFEDKLIINEEELLKVIDNNNYKIFEGEVIVHLLEGVVLIPIDKSGIHIKDAALATDKSVQDKKKIVKEYKERVKVYEYIVNNVGRVFEMQIEEKVTFEELKQWYDGFFKSHYRRPADWDLEEYRYEDKVYLDLYHDESYKEGYTYFMVKDGPVQMRYEIEDDVKSYEWSPRLLTSEDIPLLKERLERAAKKEGIEATQYLVEVLSK